MNSYFFSTIGRKQLLAVAGMAWAFFVLTHMAGNLLIFAGPKAYNMYSHALVTNPFLIVAEVGLVIFILVHVINGLTLAFNNKKARPAGYAVASNGLKKTNLVMKTMAHQGVLILIFIVLHLITFKYGTHYEATYDGVAVRDLHRLIVEVFQKPGYVAWYAVCVVVLGFHLSHGVYSMFQTWGAHHPKYTPALKKISVVYGLVVGAGFLSQPLYVYLIHRG